jgi:hypothetical protein
VPSAAHVQTFRESPTTKMWKCFLGVKQRANYGW